MVSSVSFLILFDLIFVSGFMARMKKKDPPKRDDGMPDVIRAEPLKGSIITDRSKHGLSQEDMEQLAWLADIEKLKIESKGTPKELRDLEREEKEIDQYFRKKEYVGSASLAILEQRAELRTAGAFVEDDCDAVLTFKERRFRVRPSALKVMDDLLAEKDQGKWAEGINYMADYAFFKSEAEQGERFIGCTPPALAHQRAWAEQSLADVSEATARALLVMEYVRNECNAPIQVSETALRNDLEMLDPKAVERIVGLVRAVGDPKRISLVEGGKNDLKDEQRIGSMNNEKETFSWMHVLEVLRAGAPDFYYMEMVLETMPKVFYAHQIPKGMMYSENEEKHSFSITGSLDKIPKPSDLVYTIGFAGDIPPTKFFMCDPKNRIVIFEPLLSGDGESWEKIANGLLEAINKRNELDRAKKEYNLVVRADGKLIIS